MNRRRNPCGLNYMGQQTRSWWYQQVKQMQTYTESELIRVNQRWGPVLRREMQIANTTHTHAHSQMNAFPLIIMTHSWAFYKTKCYKARQETEGNQRPLFPAFIFSFRMMLCTRCLLITTKDNRLCATLYQWQREKCFLHTCSTIIMMARDCN